MKPDKKITYQEWDKTLNEYLKYLKTENKSINTLQTYSKVLKSFIHFSENYPNAIPDVQVKKFLIELVENREVSDRYYSYVIDRIRNFFEYAEVPFQVLESKREKIDSKPPKFLKPEEIELLINSTEKMRNQMRNKLIIWMLYVTGLKVSELVSLNTPNIIKEGKILQEFEIKNEIGAARTVKILSQARKKYEYYLKEYLDNDLSKKMPLFHYNRKGEIQRLTTDAVRRMIREAGEIAGIHMRVTPQVLRHSFAVHLLRSDVPIRYIQDLLGHKNLNTTLIYTKTNGRDVKQKLDKVKF
jgi:integrase/recombinase XerD